MTIEHVNMLSKRYPWIEETIPGLKILGRIHGGFSPLTYCKGGSASGTLLEFINLRSVKPLKQ